MLGRQELLARERLVDRVSPRPVGDRGGRCLDVGDQVWGVRLAGLGQVDLVTDPLGSALPRQMGVRIIRRADEPGRWWQPLRVRPPVEPLLIYIELLHPDAAQRLDRR